MSYKKFNTNMQKNLYELKLLEMSQNEGRGVECVRAIISYIKRNDFLSAEACYLNEFDKIRNYPEIVEWFSMKTLYLIRGISGSGKTTEAKAMAETLNCNFFEADQFFETNGVYNFEATRLTWAHYACLENATDDIRYGKSVIVANTFTRLWEMTAYIDYAIEHDCRVVIIECTGQYKNIHGVSEAMIAKQKVRYESNEQIADLLVLRQTPSSLNYVQLIAARRIIFLRSPMRPPE